MNKIAIFLILCFVLISANPLSNFLGDSLGSQCTCSDIESMVAKNEGKKSCVYKDTKGIPTIGIGFNLKRSDAPTIIASLGLSYQSVLKGKQCLSNSQISKLFKKDLVWAKEGASGCVSSFYSQPTCIQNVLIDMTFNMGKRSLCSWPNFIKQLAAKDYKKVADNLQSSAWCGQVKSRCTRSVSIVKSC